MRISVNVIPRAKANNVTHKGGVYVVRTTALPVENRANDAVQKMLAKHFRVAKSCVQIVHGTNARTKTVEIIGL